MKVLYFFIILPIFINSQSFTRKEVIKETPEILHIKFFNDYSIPIIKDMFRKSYFNNRYCYNGTDNILCTISEKHYTEKATCLINYYNFKPEEFLRLASEKDFDNIYHGDNSDDYIFTTSNPKNKKHSLKNFPKCYKSENDFFKYSYTF